MHRGGIQPDLHRGIQTRTEEYILTHTEEEEYTWTEEEYRLAQRNTNRLTQRRNTNRLAQRRNADARVCICRPCKTSQYCIKLAFLSTIHVFGSCFRMLAGPGCQQHQVISS